MSKARKGLTLVEIIVVLIITVIVVLGFGASASRQIKRTNRETVVNELQVLASNIADCYYDQGNPPYDPATPEGMSGFKSFIGILSSEYAGFTFDMSTLKVMANGNGFELEVSDPTDVYDQKYKCWFVTKSGVQRYVMVASGGDDGIIQQNGYSTYNYGDDIVLMVKPKISE